MTVDVERQLQMHRAYPDALATAGECIHGVIGGEIVRPWTGNPGVRAVPASAPGVLVAAPVPPATMTWTPGYWSAWPAGGGTTR